MIGREGGEFLVNTATAGGESQPNVVTAPTFNLSATEPADVQISNDGKTVYTSWDDGYIRAYSTLTGALVQSWQVGFNLGAMDLSPDGSFIIVTEDQPVSSPPGNTYLNGSYVVAVDKLDLSTGLVQSYQYTTNTGTYSNASEYTFFDVAVLSNNKVFLTEYNAPGVSGWTTPKLLDLATGAFSTAVTATYGPVVDHTILAPGLDGGRVFLGETNISDARVDLYAPTGQFLSHNNYQDGVQGYDHGAVAYSGAAGLGVEGIANQVFVFDNNARLVQTLTPGSQGAGFAAAAFDATGANLFLFDIANRVILDVSTSSWSVVQTISVPYAGTADWTTPPVDFGNRLIVDPTSHFLVLTTDAGVQLIGNPAASPINGTEGDDVIEGTVFDDTINGLGGNDTINGGARNDTLDGGAGIDTLSYAGAAGGVTVSLAVTTPQDTGGAGTDTVSNFENLTGSSFADTLTGNDADNVIDGGAGADHMIGGLGNDVYYVDNREDVVTENPGEGTDEVRTTLASYTLPDNVENLTGLSATGQSLTGNGLGNVIVGGPGNDTLSGSDGDDTFVGNAGNDTLDGGAGSDTVDYSVEAGGGDVIANLRSVGIFGSGGLIIGADQARDTYGNIDTLVSIENVKTGSGNDTVYGDSGANRIETGAGDDSLLGGGGADTLIGGPGNDTYYIRAADGAFIGTIVEQPGEGTDAVNTDLAVFSLAGIANVEWLIGVNPAGQTLTGNELDNSISATSGNDIIDGGLGADLMAGGPGNDIYYVDNVGDVVTEAANAGTDEVRTTLSSYTLPANVENLTGLLDTGQTLIGNSLDNVITGGTGNDTILIGNGGNDHAIGGEGDDTFFVAVGTFGATHQHVVEGGPGTNVLQLQSGLAQEFLTLSNGGPATTGDRVDASGMQTVQLLSGFDTSRGYAAGKAVSYFVTLQDSFAAAGTTLTLDASGLTAAEGLRLDATGMKETDAFLHLIGGAGSDYVYASPVGSLLEGNDGNDYLFANKGDDVLMGGAGDDQLTDDLGFGGGTDLLDGGDGNDVFNLVSGATASWTSVRILGGAGNDFASVDIQGVTSPGAASIDLGDGDDTVSIKSLATALSVTLGSGSDGIKFTYLAGAAYLAGSLTVTDFQTGTGGDYLNWFSALQAFIPGFSNGSNPFAMGDARLVQDGADTLLQIRNSNAVQFATLVRFQNHDVTDFTSANVGFAPTMLVGGDAAETFSSSAGNDTFDGGGGIDTLSYASAGAGVTVSLAVTAAQDTGGAGTDTISNFENLTGSAFADTLTGNDGDNVIDGAAGADHMTGGLGNDIYYVDDAGDVVTENPGEGTDEVRTTLSSYTLPANVENLTGIGTGFQTLRGNAADNVIATGAGGGLVRFDDGGNDTGIGGSGNDVFLFGASLNSADNVDGGAGTDQIAIQGDYWTAPLTLGAGVVSVESLVLLPGSDTRFGDPGTNFYSYNITTVDQNVAAGVQMTVDANRLRPGENFTFDGSAE
ncbi:MAG TPA: hypothetical protein VH331_12660, partial [Allosphingosinicella sp.]|nr:hypothetical protein [Allosphingosinicella sp.]